MNVVSYIRTYIYAVPLPSDPSSLVLHIGGIISFGPCFCLLLDLCVGFDLVKLNDEISLTPVAMSTLRHPSLTRSLYLAADSRYPVRILDNDGVKI